MSIQPETLSTRPDTPIDGGTNFEWLDSESLAKGFRAYNEGLDVPKEYSDSLDSILANQSETISDCLADHQRRVGGYAGILLPRLFPEYDDAFHIGLIRVIGAVHDIGKEEIDRDVMYRSIGVEGYGTFNRTRDMPEVIKHTFYGYELLTQKKDELPVEAPFIAACHHQFPDVRQEPYGMDLMEVNRRFANNPEMAKWVRAAVEVVSLADYFDATSRFNGYFSSVESRNSGLLNYFKLRQPHKHLQILQALEHEKMHYQIQIGKIALVA
jgi:hypothetical protein